VVILIRCVGIPTNIFFVLDVFQALLLRTE